MKFKSIIIILVIFIYSCKPYYLRILDRDGDGVPDRPEDIKVSIHSYSILEIDSTEDYYILKTVLTKSKDSATLVLHKKSEQIINRKLKLNNTYEFETYSFFDLVAYGGPYCHEVQRIRVWCDSENATLHFTDSMGNTEIREGVIK